MTTIEQAASRLPGDAWISQSIAQVLLDRGPAHALLAHPLGGAQKEKPSPAMEFGTLVDALVFGGDIGVAPCGPRNRKEGKAEEAEIKARGLKPMPRRDYELAISCADAALRVLGPCRPDDEVQRRIKWTCSHERVNCEGTPDIVRLDDGLIVDLKTVGELGDLDLGRHCVKFGYHLQAAAYLEGVSRFHGIDEQRLRFAWVFVASNYPHETMIATPDDSMLELGRVMWARAKKQWAWSLRSLPHQRWSREVGTFESPAIIEAPSWAVKEIPE